MLRCEGVRVTADQTDETLLDEWEEKLVDPPDRYGHWRRGGARRLLKDFAQRLLTDERQKRGKCLYCDDTAKAVYPVCYKHRNADLRKQ